MLRQNCFGKYQSIEKHFIETKQIDAESGREWSGDAVYESILNLSYYLIRECLMRSSSVVVFLCADSDVHTMAAIGVMSAGGLYCPLPPQSSYREVESAVALIKPTFLVTDRHNYGIAAIVAAENHFIKVVIQKK